MEKCCFYEMDCVVRLKPAMNDADLVFSQGAACVLKTPVDLKIDVAMTPREVFTGLYFHVEMTCSPHRVDVYFEFVHGKKVQQSLCITM